MTDRELIEYLWNLLANDITDGDVPSEEEYAVLEKEFKERGIIENELFEGYY